MSPGTLYCPHAGRDPNLLQITEADAARERPTQRQRSKTFTSFSQTLENMDLPLHTFLRRFGTIIPEHIGDTAGHTAGCPAGPHIGWIHLRSVCFHTLHKVAKVKIEWVDCLSLHLEFNNRTRALKMFRFPSLCFIMCCTRTRSPFSQ